MTEDDLYDGAKLICIETTSALYRVGREYEVLSVTSNERYPYTLESDTHTICFNFEELTGNASFSMWRFVPSAELTDKELFTLRMTGKIPERLLC